MLSCIILLDSVLYSCKIYILRDAQIGIYFASSVSKLINSFLVKNPTNTATINAMQ